jgi:hypothetical protein
MRRFDPDPRLHHFSNLQRSPEGSVFQLDRTTALLAEQFP